MVFRLRRHKQAPAPLRPSQISDAHADKPDLAGRRDFLARHILIHTHIPKTAGSTLATGLSSIVGGVHAMDLRLARRVDLEEMTTDDLADLKLISGHFPYGMHTRFNRAPLYFAAVRDPVERAVSAYRFLLTHPTHNDHPVVLGRDFPSAWQALQDKRGDRGKNEQARLIMGGKPGDAIDPETLWKQAEHAYFLIIPQPRMTEAIHALRAAFGIPWAKIAPMNASKGHDTTPGDAMSRLILEADELDAALYARIEADFPARLQRACDVIASHCLMPLQDGA